MSVDKIKRKVKEHSSKRKSVCVKTGNIEDNNIVKWSLKQNLKIYEWHNNYLLKRVVKLCKN